MQSGSSALDQLLYPKVPLDNWQMLSSDKIALTGLLSRMRPRVALEIGIYYGGSLTLAAAYAEKIIAIDIDPRVNGRFDVPANAEILIGNSTDLVPGVLERIKASGEPLNYVLIDADHSSTGVRRDIELVLDYRPTEPMLIVLHDSGNPGCRAGMLAADWSKNPNLHWVDVDFVPGQIVEHSAVDGRGEVWGGLALAYLDGTPRTGPVQIRQSSRSSVAAMHHFGP